MGFGYLCAEILLVICCAGGILYLIILNKKYKSDKTSSKEDIINYFKEHKAFDTNSGIKVKDLPKAISKNPYLMMMVKDKTLAFEKGKYYLKQ